MPSRYLIRRNGTYHFRIRVPRDLQNITGTKEIHQSMRTQNARTARSMADTLLSNCRTAFTTARHQLLMGLNADHVRHYLKATLKGGAMPSSDRTAPSGPECNAAQPEAHLSKLAEQFIADRKAAWSSKTLLQHSSALRQFALIVGDKPIVEVGRKDCRAYRDLLAKLPPNATKRFPKMSFEKIAALGESPMSPKNVNRVLGAVTAFFNWAVREEFISHNPARSLSVPLTKRADAQRDVFSANDLRLLFEQSPLYRGCKSPDQRDQPGMEIIRDSKFWLPLIALYSGMRLEEIAQLRTKDVREVDGIWALDVNADGENHLKTRDSQRIVPLHPTLVSSGFLTYASDIQKDGFERLWPDLSMSNDGYFSSTFSKWFGRYKRKIGITNPRVTFHSLRHTAINHLKQAGIDEGKIKELVGHADHSITMSRYGKRYRPGVLLMTVRTLDYNLDLRHLRSETQS